VPINQGDRMSNQIDEPREKWWQAEDLQCTFRHFSRLLFLLPVGLLVLGIVMIQEWLAGIR
jgi:hypothetical protein